MLVPIGILTLAIIILGAFPSIMIENFDNVINTLLKGAL